MSRSRTSPLDTLSLMNVIADNLLYKSVDSPTSPAIHRLCRLPCSFMYASTSRSNGVFVFPPDGIRVSVVPKQHSMNQPIAHHCLVALLYSLCLQDAPAGIVLNPYSLI
jgi:hypothetical protein